MNNETAERYLTLRKQALDYTNVDMNLDLENDRQVYIAVFDIPAQSLDDDYFDKTLVLIFGLNVHIYYADGSVKTDLEQDPRVMQAMMSLLVSSGQVLDDNELTSELDFYKSNKVRAYLKAGKGTYKKELADQSKEASFLKMLLKRVLVAL